MAQPPETGRFLFNGSRHNKNNRSAKAAVCEVKTCNTFISIIHSTRSFEKMWANKKAALGQPRAPRYPGAMMYVRVTN